MRGTLILRAFFSNFWKLNVKREVAPLYSGPEAGEQCFVKILDKYISRLPQDAVLEDIFHLCSLENFSEKGNKPWFACAPLRKNMYSSRNGEEHVYRSWDLQS